MFKRFDIHQRIQHIMMFTSFIICTVTGLPIKYDHAPWAHFIVHLFGGFETMFYAHLFGATIMIASGIYHLAYLACFGTLIKGSLAALPNLKDARDLAQNIKYFLGRTDKKPQFDRYSYKEKFDYWAVFWGMVIMGGSGLMMWFPDITSRFVPRIVIDCARVAHSDEAMLAILAIFIWHFFNVHFHPDFFPGNSVWFHGMMSRELMEHEHPMELAKLEASELAPAPDHQLHV